MERIITTTNLDTEAKRLLAEIAQREFDGNKSMALRRIIRQAAKSYGLQVTTGANDGR